LAGAAAPETPGWSASLGMASSTAWVDTSIPFVTVAERTAAPFAYQVWRQPFV
jgi:hypothetical protein